MDFKELIQNRQSCRSYDIQKQVEKDKLDLILEAARLSPSACNGQPYHITVCKGEAAKKVAKSVQGMGMNKFASEAPIMLVISEKPYVRTAAVGAKLKNNDYRSIDIGIATAHICAQATELGLSTCILGWLDDAKIRQICGIDETVRLVITLGYAKEGDPLRTKKRKDISELVTVKE